ncbi:MAG TPA: DUF4159 domain-containing protein [Phycisphaerae bacterium]|nr:DUF4159 domain-containing protein [Phycisphaerae bacterium]HRW52384.1 DUF4159 domain-containing protein [Phycisphaerae bacterium]
MNSVLSRQPNPRSDARLDHLRAARRVWIAAACIALSTGLASRARADVSAEAVDREIEKGKASLLATIRDRDEITWRIGTTVRTRSESGVVTRQRGGEVELKTDKGDLVKIPRSAIVVWRERGFVTQEMSSIHHGGPTALAAFALFSADVELSNERMKMMVDALVDHELPEAGTYVRSLRAGVWAKLINAPRITEAQRVRFKRLLYKDVQWLQGRIKPDGAFNYGTDLIEEIDRGDASNSQFANLGLWLGDLNGGEVSRETWLKVERYWMEGQDTSGGWGYVLPSSNPTSSMTVAGCNSLYIALERLYARGDRPYARYEGCRPNKKNRKRVAEIFQAIHDGNAYLRTHPPDASLHQRYELFGIERLGLASGLAEIGGQDWFPSYATAAVGHEWGLDVVADAFTLIFLVHGQAPILLQKLKHGDDEDAWNYYFRDLHGLTGFLSRTFERLYRWQYVPADADLRTLNAAPILMISGHAPLSIDQNMRLRLRQYVDNGGLILLHSDRASRRFGDTAKPIFESMFRREGWTFRRLDNDHPLYTCMFRSRNPRKPIPLEAISDGPRLLVVYSPVDLAGAWHQQRNRFTDIFEIMANLRAYSAPEHDRLPRVLRSEAQEPPAKPNRGELRIKRFAHGGDWDAHLGMWERLTDRIQRTTGIRVIPDESGKVASDLSDFDLVHMTTRGRIRPTDEEIETLRAYIQGGGMLVAESADGTAKGNRVMLKLLRLLGFDNPKLLTSADPLATGAFPEGAPLTRLVATRFSSRLMMQSDTPPIFLGMIDGRVAVIACPFDLSAGFEGRHVWDCVGFEPESTDRIVRNILNFRYAQIHRLFPETRP